jgi:hypothetical protein
VAGPAHLLPSGRRDSGFGMRSAGVVSFFASCRS